MTRSSGSHPDLVSSRSRLPRPGVAGGNPAPPDRTRLAIARAIRLAVKNGLAVAPKEEWDQLLWAKFDGNIFEINETIAYYDEDDDELVINDSHLAWADMRDYIQDPRNVAATSPPDLPDHIHRHEIGHALHYRRLTLLERADIWYKGLIPEEKLDRFPGQWLCHGGRIEFVAEVLAGHGVVADSVPT